MVETRDGVAPDTVLDRLLRDPRAWCAAAAVVAAVFIAWRTLTDTILLYHPLPYWDSWDFMVQLPHYLSGDFPWSEFWAPHNEHRIPLPRLVFLADALWFGGNGASIVVLSCLAHYAHAALLAVAVAGSVPRGPTRILVGATVAGCMLFPSQSLNLFWAFQVQFVLVYVAVTAALYQIARPRPGPGRLLAAVLLAIVASGSMANGLLVWPLLWSLCLQLRLPRRTLVVLFAAGTLVLIAYLWQYEPRTVSELVGAFSDPLRMCVNTCMLLGNPLWTLGLETAAIAGGITLLLALWTLLRHLRTWFRASPAEALLLHLVLLVLATFAMISVARLHMPREDILNCRFGLPVLVLWSALVGLMFVGARPTGATRWRMGVAIAFAMALALLSPRHRELFGPIRDAQVYTSACLLSGVADEDMLRMTHDVDPTWTMTGAGILRSRRLSVFGSGLQYLIGDYLLNHFAVDSGGDQKRNVTSHTNSPQAVRGCAGAVHFEGWAFDSSTGTPPDLLLVVDESWHIAGLGMCSGAQAEEAAGHPLRNPRIRWHAWARDLESASNLAVFGVWDGVARPVYRPPAAEPPEQVLSDDFGRLGPAVTLLGLEATGSWCPHGIHPTAPEPPAPTLTIGSWNGSDFGTGRVRAAIAGRPEVAELLVPVLSGPDAMQMVMRIRDARSGKVHASLTAPQPFPYSWRLWQVVLPACSSGEHWILEAEDLGQGQGQWLAIGVPHWTALPR